MENRKDYSLLTHILFIRQIMGHTQADEALRESEERFSKAFGTSPYAFMIARMEDGAIIDVNDAFTTISGFTREESLASSTIHLNIWVNEEDRKHMTAVLREGGIVVRQETRLRAKNGKILTVLLSAQIIRLGNRPCIISIIDDITVRKQMEQVLRDSENSYRTLMEQASDGIFIADKQGNYIDVNLRGCAMFGYSREEILRLNMKDLLTTEEIAVTPLKFKELSSGQAVLSERRMRRKDGSVLYAEISGKTLTDGRFQGIIRDITERKKAEETLKLQSEILMNIEEGVQLTRITDAVIVFANPRFEKMFGYQKGELTGKNVSILDIPDGKNQNSTAANIQSCLQKTGVWHGEIQNIRKDGTTFWCRANISTFNHSEYGNVWVATHEDITDRKRMEEELQKAQKLESLGILAGGIAHDFNNLLAGIFCNVDMARYVSTDAQTKEYLEATLGAMNRAKALTHQLLTFARGGMPVLKTTSLISFIQETVQFALSGSNILCNFILDKNLWACNIDKNQICQVIDNIIINAQQAMPNGGTIDITAKNISIDKNEFPALAKGSYVKVSIKDCGIGIPRGIMHNIFDPFFTTKSKGHGLGLAICYSIINRHGGLIDVESVPEKGSTFHIYLPATTEYVPEEIATPDKLHKGSGIIIVMDDEEVIQNALRKILESMGYTVVCTNDGKEVVDFYTKETRLEHKFAAMIFDFTVPGGMGGIKAVSEIRTLDAVIPVFVASGYADDPVMRNPVEFGFTASICKPFSIADLSIMLNAYL